MIPSVRFDEINTTDTYLYFEPNIWVPFFARCRLTNDSRKTKRFSPLARWMLLNFVTKYDSIWIVSCSWSNHTTLLLMFVSEKVLLLLVISLTAKWITEALVHARNALDRRFLIQKTLTIASYNIILYKLWFEQDSELESWWYSVSHIA